MAQALLSQTENKVYLINRQKPFSTKEALDIFQNNFDDGTVEQLPFQPKGGEVYKFYGYKNTKTDWKVDGHKW